MTGLEAANRVISSLNEGEKAEIIPIEEDEWHVKELRKINKEARKSLFDNPIANFFLR